MNAAEQLAPQVGIAAACQALGVSRASFYRQQQPSPVIRRQLFWPAHCLTKSVTFVNLLPHLKCSYVSASYR
jgi:hypothetical protein